MLSCAATENAKTVDDCTTVYTTEVSSDDNETEEAAITGRNENVKVSLRVTRKDKIRNEHIRGTLKVDRFGQKVRQSRLR